MAIDPGESANRERVRHRRLRTLAFAGAAVVVATTTATILALEAGRSGPARRATGQLPSVRTATRPTAAIRARRHGSTAAVPILIYHVIAAPIPNAPYPGLYVPAADFAAQMRALAAAGFDAVTLDQVHAAWQGRGKLPSRPVVLTFDNGYRTQYTTALPILRRLGWVGDENLQLSGLPPSQGGLSLQQVRDLIAAGWEVDTQGYSHADLIVLNPSQLHFQVAVARRMIQRRYHIKANWFCYPSGHYNTTVIAAVKAAGYVGSSTVVPGWAQRSDDPYRLPRLRVLAGTSPEELLSLIRASQHLPPPPARYPSR